MIVHSRTGWLTACASACVLLLTACGGGGGGAEPAVPPPAPPAEGGAFPVRVEHDPGTTEIPSRPQRVVSLGYTGQDPILALDVVPVAIREFTGGRPSATRPWAADRLGGQQPQVLDGTTIDPETIAALAPDLIVAISAGLTQDQYDQFSAIAPTIVEPEGDIPFGTPWQDATRIVGEALGRSAGADQLVSDLEARFEQVRAANRRSPRRPASSSTPTSASSSCPCWTGPTPWPGSTSPAVPRRPRCPPSPAPRASASPRRTGSSRWTSSRPRRCRSAAC